MNIIQAMTAIAIERMLDLCPACHEDLFDGSTHSHVIDGVHDRCVSSKYNPELIPLEDLPTETVGAGR